jgi:Domain of unknown function (DUF4124)
MIALMGKAGAAMIAVLALGLAGAAQAQVYKWTDEQGRVHYGEKPPPGAGATTIKPPAESGKPAAPEDFKDRDAQFRQRQLERAQREEAEAHAAQVRQRRCDDAEDELKRAESSRLYRREGGQRVYLTDAEQQAYLDKLRQVRARNCR